MHDPRDDHFSLLLYISMQHRARHPLRADAANRRRPDRLHFLSPQRVSPKVCAHVAWADGHHMNSEVLQFHSRRFAECVHGKFGRAVHSVEGKRFADSHGSAGHYDNLAGHVDFFAHAELLSSLHWPVSRWRKMKNTSVTLGSHEHTPASIPA